MDMCVCVHKEVYAVFNGRATAGIAITQQVISRFFVYATRVAYTKTIFCLGQPMSQLPNICTAHLGTSTRPRPDS